MEFYTSLFVFSRLTCVSGLPLMVGVPHSTPHPTEPAAQEAAYWPFLADNTTLNEDPVLRDFRQWRFDNDANDTSFVTSGPPDEEPKPKGPKPLYDAPFAVLRDCAGYALKRLPEDQVELHSTGGATPSLPRMFFTDERLVAFVDSVDHIYVICVKCSRTFPPKLREKVSLVKAALSDSCIMKYLGLAPSMSHQRRVTLAHRVAIMDAQVRNAKLALVLEEDVFFTEGAADFDYASIQKLMYATTRSWDVIRLAWYDHNQTISTECQATRVRRCNRWMERSMCTTPSCDLHSSAAYILPARSYDRFLTQGRGVIDSMPLNQFNQTVVMPALGHQPVYFKRELKAQRAFMTHCKGFSPRSPL